MSKNKQNKYITLNTILLGFSVGAIVPLMVWIIEIYNRPNIIFDKYGIIFIHSTNPGIYVADIAPFALTFVFYLVTKNSIRIKKELNETIIRMNQVLQRNSDFAKRIGQGDLNANLDISSDDVLGKSLLLMRNNLVETSKRETEQTWITRGKEMIGDILRFHNEIEILSYQTITTLVDYTNSVQGAFYIFDEDKQILTNIATHAYNRKKYENKTFKIGQGLIGAAAFEKEIIYRKEIPEDYITISSGILGDKKPKSLIIAPLLGDEKLQGVIEIASLEEDMSVRIINLMKEISKIVGQTVFNLKVNNKTEKLLQESRDMTYKLKKNEEELRQNAEQMKKTQKELEETNRKLAMQISEVERSQKRLNSLLENTSEIITIVDENGIITYESPSLKSILGMNPEDLIGNSIFTSFSRSANNLYKNAFKKIIENPNETVSFEYVSVKEDGTEIWLESTGRNLLDNVAINGIMVNTRDITVRKVAEKAKRMSGRMQALSENSIDMIIRVNTAGVFFYANPIAEQFINVGKRNILGKTIEETNLPTAIKNVFSNALNRIIKNNIQFDSETTFPLNDDNGERIVQFNAIPEFNEQNELETILFVAHDITEQKTIQLEIEKKNKSITESINYAKRIQTAILPTQDKIRETLPNSFMFYLPRDVVSGDIPWIYKQENVVYIAAIDCTGHGVPGALLSFIGYFLINNIVSTEGKILNAGQMLDKLHHNVRKTLNQDSPDAEARDGMDIALCKINLEKNQLDFAGAHRPLYYLKNDGELLQYKGALKAIGGIPMKNRPEKSFINHIIEYEKKDKIFFFSDGLADQIGGEKGRKFKNNKIREIITENKEKSIFEFHKIIEDEFISWKGDFKQIDDIILLGIEF